MKRIMSGVVVVMLFISIVFLAFNSEEKTSAAAVEGLKDVTVTYENANGDTATEIKNDTTRIKLRYNFEFATTGSSGKQVSFQLPSDIFKLPAKATDVPLVSNGENLGTYSISDTGLVTLNFKPNLSNVNAWFGLTTWIEPAYKWESNEQKVTLADGKEITLTASFGHGNKKSGKLDGRKITWTVDVNKNLQSITDGSAIVTDAIHKDLALDTTSIKVYKLGVAADGSVTPGATPITSGITTSNSTASNLEVNLGNPVTGAYRIVFDTAISPTAPDQTFTNTAVFKGVNIVSEGVKFERKIDIAKKVISPTTSISPTNTNPSTIENVIEWEIIINESGEMIEKDTILNDTVRKYTGQQPLNIEVDSSIVIQRKNGSAWESTNDLIVLPPATNQSHVININAIHD